MKKYVVIDFETTGFSRFDEIIEIGAVLVDRGRIKQRYNSLIKPIKKINSSIENITGITNRMLVNAPPKESVMKKFLSFIGGYPIVAHNASFERKFLNREMEILGKELINPIGCSLLVSRRIYQDFPDHKLSTLIDLKKIRVVGSFHRALPDAEMTASLWEKMKRDIEKRYRLKVDTFEFMMDFGKTPKDKIHHFLKEYK